MAFAGSDDHEAQERVWRELPEWQTNDPSVIRDMLTEHEITASDRRVKFVTLKAYEKAGGAVRRDPFCGSGSTLVAAQKLNRGYLGIEIDPVHHNTAQTRLARALLRAAA
jgi:DNA methylase